MIQKTKRRVCYYILVSTIGFTGETEARMAYISNIMPTPFISGKSENKESPSFNAGHHDFSTPIAVFLNEVPLSWQFKANLTTLLNEEAATTTLSAPPKALSSQHTHNPFYYRANLQYDKIKEQNQLSKIVYHSAHDKKNSSDLYDISNKPPSSSADADHTIKDVLDSSPDQQRRDANVSLYSFDIWHGKSIKASQLHYNGQREEAYYPSLSLTKRPRYDLLPDKKEYTRIDNNDDAKLVIENENMKQVIIGNNLSSDPDKSGNSVIQFLGKNNLDTAILINTENGKDTDVEWLSHRLGFYNTGQLTLKNVEMKNTVFINNANTSWSGDESGLTSAVIVNAPQGRMTIENAYLEPILSSKIDSVSSPYEYKKFPFYNEIRNDGFLRICGTNLGADIDNKGTAQFIDMKSFNGDIRNAGTIIIGLTEQEKGNLPFDPSQLVINGNYTGAAGTIVLAGVLDGNYNPFTSVRITGDTTGISYIDISSASGQGGETSQGILLVKIDGQSNGDFLLAAGRRIVKGPYEYDIIKIGKDWYLASQLTDISDGTPLPYIPDKQFRPEVGSYLANVQTTRTMFLFDFSDRLASHINQKRPAARKYFQSVWINQNSSMTGFHDLSGQLNIKSRQTTTLFGTDILQTYLTSSSGLVVGLFGGYGLSDNSTSSRRQYYSHGSIHGYSAGLYGTWIINMMRPEKTYIDIWSSYNSFKGTVKGDYLSKEETQHTGMSASIELAHTFTFAHLQTSELGLQPHIQAIYTNISMKKHKEKYGTNVRTNSSSIIKIRPGAEVYWSKMQSLTGEQSFKAFVEINWEKDNHDNTVIMDEKELHRQGNLSLTQFKLGLEGRISQNISIAGIVSYSIGYNEFAYTQGNMIIRAQF